MKDRVRAFYAESAEREWNRLLNPTDGAAEFAVNRRAISRHLPVSSDPLRILDIDSKRKPKGPQPKPPTSGPRDRDQYRFSDPEAHIMKNTTDKLGQESGKLSGFSPFLMRTHHFPCCWVIRIGRKPPTSVCIASSLWP